VSHVIYAESKLLHYVRLSVTASRYIQSLLVLLTIDAVRYTPSSLHVL